MKKRIFAVCDTEAEYARNFMEYVSRRKNIPFEVQVFTNVESLLDFAGRNHIELLLISQEAMCGAVRDLDIGKVIILTEGVRPPELEAYAGVYKYQSSSQVVKEVMACYGKEKSVLPAQTPVMKKTTEILRVYSPMGRCSEDILRADPGTDLSRERPVLYLNQEEYYGFEDCLAAAFREAQRPSGLHPSGRTDISGETEHPMLETMRSWILSRKRDSLLCICRGRREAGISRSRCSRSCYCWI